jgi:PKD repeat protein
VTATATDSNGLTATTSITVTVSSLQHLTPPSIQLFAPQVAGLTASFNGVMMPTTSGASIPKPACWSFGDGTSGCYWFPTSHTFQRSGIYTVTATATDSNGLTTSATVKVTVK